LPLSVRKCQLIAALFVAIPGRHWMSLMKTLKNCFWKVQAQDPILSHSINRNHKTARTVASKCLRGWIFRERRCRFNSWRKELSTDQTVRDRNDWWMRFLYCARNKDSGFWNNRRSTQLVLSGSSVPSPKFGGTKNLVGQSVDFRRATAFCLGYRPLRQKITRYAPWPPPVTPPVCAVGWGRWRQHLKLELILRLENVLLWDVPACRVAETAMTRSRLECERQSHVAANQPRVRAAVTWWLPVTTASG